MKADSYKILLVDDDPDIRSFLGYNIKRSGYHYLTCLNGFDAIDIAKNELPHLIILDVMMPEMDGFQTCHELKKIPEELMRAHIDKGIYKEKAPMLAFVLFTHT